MLALRTERGIILKEYRKAFGTDFTEDYKAAIKKTQKYLDITEEKISIKDEYLYVQNGIITEFM